MHREPRVVGEWARQASGRVLPAGIPANVTIVDHSERFVATVMRGDYCTFE